MRTRHASAVLLAAPVLLGTVACESGDNPIRGTVEAKEHEPAKTCLREKDCVTRPECYELTIRQDYTGEIVEVCDKAAYNALEPEDRYSSTIDYSREGQW